MRWFQLITHVFVTYAPSPKTLRAMPLKSHILSSGIGTNSRIFQKLFQKFLTTQNRPKNSQKRKKTRKPISPFQAPRPYHPALLQWLNKGDPRRHHNWLPHRNKRLEPPSERASVRYEEAPKAKPQGRGTAPLRSQWMGHLSLHVVTTRYQFQWWKKIWPTLVFFCFFWNGSFANFTEPGSQKQNSMLWDVQVQLKTIFLCTTHSVCSVTT